MSDQESKFSRRDFLGAVAAVSTIAVATGSCAKKGAEIPVLAAQAPDGAPIKAGLIGCGGRGTGAAKDFLKAGNNLVITAIGDTFQDRLDSCREQLKKEGQNISDDRCFVGLDAYKKVIDAGVDLVIMATPPFFRPEHFRAAIDAGKHVFMEKPVAVDPMGVKQILQAAEQATQKGLSVVTGNQRRNQYHYLKALQMIRNGAIGDLVGGQVYWNQSQLWYKERQKGWSDMEWMIRDWVNWVWLSGDHIVEQHVHNIDVMNWFMNAHPVKAVGMGGRARRITGDQFDFFAVDYEMA
ncbi:Gfo/Idh/MocA family oxidoreductase, partial [bacterium]|nr:Gfo/Idh/MocA family oxidoreductase [bacterium]